MNKHIKADRRKYRKYEFLESEAEHRRRIFGRFGGTRQTKIQRSALMKKLNWDMHGDELIRAMGPSNCPRWLADASVEDLLLELEVKIVPSPDADGYFDLVPDE